VEVIGQRQTPAVSPQQIKSQYSLNRRLYGPSSKSGGLEEEIISDPCWESNYDSFDVRPIG
jgi:hypothetical protein